MFDDEKKKKDQLFNAILKSAANLKRQPIGVKEPPKRQLVNFNLPGTHKVADTYNPNLLNKFLEGATEGASFNLVDIPVKKSKTPFQKLSYAAGNIAGSLLTGSGIAKVLKGVPLLGKAIATVGSKGEELLGSASRAKQLLGVGLKGAEAGLPYAVGQSVSEKIREPEKKSFAKEFGKQTAFNVLGDIALSPIPIIGPILAAQPTGEKKGIIKSVDDFLATVAREYKLKPIDDVYEASAPKLKLKEVLKKLADKYHIDKDILHKIEKGGVLEGDFGVAQRQGGDIVINLVKKIPETFQLEKPVVKKAIKKASEKADKVRNEISKVDLDAILGTTEGAVKEAPKPKYKLPENLLDVPDPATVKYKRGDMGKYEAWLDELLGTSTYDFGGSWKSRLAARQTARNELEYAVESGDELAKKYLDAVNKVESILDKFRYSKNKPKVSEAEKVFRYSFKNKDTGKFETVEFKTKEELEKFKNQLELEKVKKPEPVVKQPVVEGKPVVGEEPATPAPPAEPPKPPTPPKPPVGGEASADGNDPKYIKTFFEQAREYAREAGNIGRFYEVNKIADHFNEIAVKMREADLKLDPSLTDTIASMLGINNIWRRIARLVEEKTGRQFTKFSFTDPKIDDAAKKELVFLLQGLRSRVGLDLRVAKREAQDMLGRELTEQEVGSILRQDVDKILKYAKHGHSKVKLGPEFEDKELVGRLYEAFRDVGNDLAAFTLAYHKKLDEYLEKGMISEELYKRASLTPAKQYIQNLGKYVRTFYDKEKYVTGKNLYEPILHDFGLYTPSRLRKLTNEQMAIKYLKTLKQEGVAIAEGVPQELVDRVKNGDKEALDELGQVIREALGYITEGEKAIRKTTNYLTQNLYNLIIMDMIVNNKEFISEKQKEGFVKVVDKSLGILYGKWVRKDVYNDLVDGMRFVQETPDLLGIYSSLLKFSIVTARPGAWIRNITYASWVQQTLAGNSPLNPKNWQYFVKGTKEYLEVLSDPRKASETFKLFNELGGGSGSYTTEEAIKLITFLEESGGLKDAKSFIRSLRDFANKGVSNLGEMYSHLDAIQKYVLFLKKLDDGLTPEEAVLYAQRYINNYALNPKFFRELSKSTVGSMLLPFISFTVANTPVLVESVVRYPHRMAMIIGAPYLAGKLFTILHPELRDQIEAQKPTHQKDNILYTSVGYDPETGKITYWDLSNFFNLPAYKPGKDLPIEIAKSLSGSFVMPGGLLSPLSTAITGKDVFGRDVELPYAEGRKGALANLLPGGLLMNEIKEVINSIEGKPYSSSGKVLTVPEALARFFGVNLTHTFPNQVMKNLNEINMKYGEKMAVYKRVVQDPYASEKEKAYALEQIAKLRDEKAQKQAEMVLPYIQSALKQKGENGALEQPTATVVDKPVNVVSGGGLVDLGKLGGGGSKSYRGSVKLKKVPKIPTTSFKLTSGLAPFQIVSTPSKKKKPRMISLDQLPISPLSNYRLR